MSKATGGPAFPVTIDPRVGFPMGLTKREIFAMNQDLSKIEVNSLEHLEELVGRPFPRTGAFEQLQFQAEAVAKIRFIFADAMLAESNKE